MKTRTLAGIIIASTLAVSAAQTVSAADVQQKPDLRGFAQEETCKKTFVQKGQYFICEPTHSPKATCKWPQGKANVTSYTAYLSDKFAGRNRLDASKQGSYC